MTINQFERVKTQKIDAATLYTEIRIAKQQVANLDVELSFIAVINFLPDCEEVG